jgi:hypothetical protein
MESSADISNRNDGLRNHKDDEKEASTASNPLYMYEYLQKLGNRQKQIIENFYHSAVDKSCPDIICDDTHNNGGFMCNFLSTLDEDVGQVGIDGLGQNIVGPRMCEYCNAKDTKECQESCERPKLYFIKRRPPFENSKEGYSKSGELLADLDLCKFSK